MAETEEKKPNPLSKEARAKRAEEKLKQLSTEPEVRSDRQYIFETTDGSPVLYLPSKIAMVDPESGTIRTANYNKVEESIWLDEQENKFTEKFDRPIFKNGKLIVSGREKSKVKFLLAHDWIEGKEHINPRNNTNRGKFRLIDKNLALRNSKDKRELIAKANKVILESELEDLKRFMKSEFGIDPYTDKKIDNPEDSLYDKAYEKSFTHAEKFVVEFNNPKHEIKSNILQGFHLGLLDDIEDGVIKWKDTLAKIYTFNDFSKRSEDVLTAWVLTGSKDASAFYSNLKVKIEEKED